MSVRIAKPSPSRQFFMEWFKKDSFTSKNQTTNSSHKNLELLVNNEKSRNNGILKTSLFIDLNETLKTETLKAETLSETEVTSEEIPPFGFLSKRTKRSSSLLSKEEEIITNNIVISEESTTTQMKVIKKAQHSQKRKKTISNKNNENKENVGSVKMRKKVQAQLTFEKVREDHKLDTIKTAEDIENAANKAVFQVISSNSNHQIKKRIKRTRKPIKKSLPSMQLLDLNQSESSFSASKLPDFVFLQQFLHAFSPIIKFKRRFDREILQDAICCNKDRSFLPQLHICLLRFIIAERTDISLPSNLRGEDIIRLDESSFQHVLSIYFESRNQLKFAEVLAETEYGNIDCNLKLDILMLLIEEATDLPHDNLSEHVQSLINSFEAARRDLWEIVRTQSKNVEKKDDDESKSIKNKRVLNDQEAALKKQCKEKLNYASSLLRILPIGYDRNNNAYWIFPFLPSSVLMEERQQHHQEQIEEKTKWYYFKTKKDLKNYIDMLDEDHVMEKELKRTLDRQMKKLNEEFVASSEWIDKLSSYVISDEVLKNRDAYMKARSQHIIADIMQFDRDLRDNGLLDHTKERDIWHREWRKNLVFHAKDMTILLDCVKELIGAIDDKWISPSFSKDKWLATISSIRTYSSLSYILYDLRGGLMWSRPRSKQELRTKAKYVDDDHLDNCEICFSGEDDASMLLCDGCDLGYHMACLDPPLTRIPAGDWYCPDCAPSFEKVACDSDLENPTNTFLRRSSRQPQSRENSSRRRSLRHH